MSYLWKIQVGVPDIRKAQVEGHKGAGGRLYVQIEHLYILDWSKLMSDTYNEAPTNSWRSLCSGQ